MQDSRPPRPVCVTAAARDGRRPGAVFRPRRGRRPKAGAMQTIDAKIRYRTIFLSDVHLGTKGCRSDFLLDFLRRTECEQLYLVGDIVDGWRLRKSWYWTAEFDEVLREILTLARRGVQVTYIPGN